MQRRRAVAAATAVTTVLGVYIYSKRRQPVPYPAASSDDAEENDDVKCAICRIHRQGPCRAEWLPLERCFKKHSDLDDKEGFERDCSPFFAPLQACMQENSEYYSKLAGDDDEEPHSATEGAATTDAAEKGSSDSREEPPQTMALGNDAGDAGLSDDTPRTVPAPANAQPAVDAAAPEVEASLAAKSGSADVPDDASGAAAHQQAEQPQPRAQQALAGVAVMMEEEGCPGCDYFREGPCGESFKAWERLVESGVQPGREGAGRFAAIAAALEKCMDEYPEYYGKREDA